MCLCFAQTAVANPKNRGIWSIGAVGRCLSRQLAENKALTLECRALVIVAAPKVRMPCHGHMPTCMFMHSGVLTTPGMPPSVGTIKPAWQQRPLTLSHADISGGVL